MNAPRGYKTYGYVAEPVIDRLNTEENERKETLDDMFVEKSERKDEFSWVICNYFDSYKHVNQVTVYKHILSFINVPDKQLTEIKWLISNSNKIFLLFRFDK